MARYVSPLAGLDLRAKVAEEDDTKGINLTKKSVIKGGYKKVKGQPETYISPMANLDLRTSEDDKFTDPSKDYRAAQKSNTKYDQRGDAIDTQPAKKSSSIIDKFKHVGSNVATATGHSVRAVARPAVSLVSGQGGKAAHDAAQLSSNVSGGSFNLLANAARYTPKAVYREAQGKSIDDIQKKVFGSTDSGTIAKKTAGALLQAGSFAVGGGGVAAATKGSRAASLLAKGKAVAPLTAAGGAGGAGYTIQNNPNASVKDIAKSTVLGAAGGAVIPFAVTGAGKAINKVSPYAKGSPKEFVQNTKANSLLNKVRVPSEAGTIATKEANTAHIPVIGPTETKQAQSLIGKFSTKEANTTRATIKGKDTGEVIGKAKTVTPEIYNKEFTKLSNAYEKESAAIKDHGPIRRGILQDQIDEKYTALQKQLDDSAGVTSVSFTGKPQKPVVNSIPESVLKESQAKNIAVKPITEADQQIQEILATGKGSNRPDNLRQIEQNQASLTDADRLKLAGGDTGQAGLQMPKAERDALLAKQQAAASATGEAERGTSKVAQDIQTKAVSRGLKDTFGEAGGYDKITIEDQARKAVALTNDRPALEKVLNGETPPSGLRATALIKAIEEHPQLSKDHDLINRLSQAEHLTGQSSRSAQELRLAAERSDTSPVEAIRKVREVRAKVVEKKTGKTVNKAISDELKLIRATKPKVTRQTFEEFVETLKC